MSSSEKETMSEPLRCPRCQNQIPSDAPAGLCPVCLLAAGQANDTRTLLGQGSGRFTSPLPETLAAEFPQLEVLEIIGQGGMGTVYKARQRHLDRIVALKILRPDLSSQPAFADRFTREARALASLSHPHLVTVHDFGHHSCWFWIIMEYVDGANLRQLLKEGHFTQRQALEIIPQLCEALQYAHDRGVVHRDIKPENILLDASGQVKVADFGLAKMMLTGGLDRSLTASQDVVGTAHYMAPEQIESSRDVDHRADIYSMGVVFYEMLTGGLPLGRFEPPSKSKSSSPGLDPVVMRSLEKNPEQRFQQASEVKTAIQQIEQGSSTTHSSTSGAPPSTSNERDLEGTILLITGGILTLISILELPVVLKNHYLVTSQILLLAMGSIIFYSGLQGMKASGDRRWLAPAKILSAVAIPFMFNFESFIGFGLMGVSIYWFNRYRRNKRLGVATLQPVNNHPAAVPSQAAVANSTQSMPQAVAIPSVAPRRMRLKGLIWSLLLTFICLMLVSMQNQYGWDPHHSHFWIFWPILILVMILIMVRTRERKTQYDSSPGFAQTLLSGILHLIAIVTISATALVCVGLVVLSRIDSDRLKRFLDHPSLNFSWHQETVQHHDF
jgi:serine/threonine protein kinase